MASKRNPARGGGGQSKRKHWFDNSKAKGIPQGTRGIIVSTVAGKERQATREALAILSESLEALGGPKREDGADGDNGADGDDGAEKGDTQDISALLKAEVEDLKDRSKQDFQVRDMGLQSSVYLVCNFSSPSPSEILYHALDTVRRTQQNKCRFCYRWFPIEYTCRSELEAIKAMGKQVARDVFDDGNKKEGDKTFAVDIEFRAKPKELERLDVINAFASEIGQPPWKVDLSSPDLSIVVNVVKGTCGCAVVREYRELKKYNLTMLVDHTGGDEGDEDEKDEKDEKDEEGRATKKAKVSNDAA